MPTGQSADLHVRPEHALDAFYHPFAYAASRGTVVRRSMAAAVTAVAGEGIG